ncbi:hypothetical protein RhiJN_16321 [Ceratobasidium sp. AG-Ba]|nr:hypothetical protein RhiJN_16321 [Ceratobasidium sp. AG-Ba]
MNYVTNGVFDIPNDQRAITRPHLPNIILYPSKNKNDARVYKRTVGLGTLTSAGKDDDFLRIDWDPDSEKKLHFNAVYMGSSTSIPKGDNRHTCAVTVRKAGYKAFYSWVDDLEKVQDAQDLWNIWYANHRPGNHLSDPVDEED